MTDNVVMIIEDEKVLAKSLSMDLKDSGYRVEWFEEGEIALKKLDSVKPHVILLDLRLPGIDGIEVLEQAKVWNREIPIIMMTAHGDTQTTVEAIKRGAYDFVDKPFELDEIKSLIKEALQDSRQKRELEYLRYQQRRFNRYCDLVGQSNEMQEVYRQIEVLSQTDHVTVLIRGESGTGKELVAGAIHHKSQRRKQPLMEINCASLPEPLLESELFGYEKGAFTDAKQDKKGLLELADSGSVFLDEIGETPLSIQAKLLRFLEKKTFKRLGGGKDFKVDARIIAATNKDLETAIAEGQFRSDLYYRLNVVTITIPPLRDRSDDVMLLANYFLNEFCKELGRMPAQLSKEAISIFKNHPWPGNVRELRNVMERAVIFCKGDTIDTDMLPPEFSSMTTKNSASIPHFHNIDFSSGDIDQTLASVENQMISQALQQTAGNKSQASQLLGISRFSLKRRMDRLKME